MIFDPAAFARNLNQRLLAVNRQANLHWSFIYTTDDSDWVWERLVTAAKYWDECVDLEIEIEDLIHDARRRAA